MRKVIVLVGILLPVFSFGYQLEQTDRNLIEQFEEKIERMDESKLSNIERKMEIILPQITTNERAGAIIEKLLEAAKKERSERQSTGAMKQDVIIEIESKVSEESEINKEKQEVTSQGASFLLHGNMPRGVPTEFSGSKNFKETHGTELERLEKQRIAREEAEKKARIASYEWRKNYANMNRTAKLIYLKQRQADYRGIEFRYFVLGEEQYDEIIRKIQNYDTISQSQELLPIDELEQQANNCERDKVCYYDWEEEEWDELD